MIKVVEDYFAARDAANAEFREQKDIARKQWKADADTTSKMTERDRAERTYYARENALQRIRDARLHLLWAELAMSDDTTVRFIATRAPEYRAQAEVVLRALPADLSTLRRLKREQNWCSAYTNMLNDAIAQGIVVDTMGPERRKLSDWMDANLSTRATADVTTMVDAIVAAEAADFVTKAAAVKDTAVETADDEDDIEDDEDDEE